MSIGSLCMQRRKVYYGNNLFAKGACAAGKERLEDKILKGYRYMSPALVLKDVGMEMRVMGAPAYYPLIEAGKNWYECKAGCELILDDITELVFVVGTFGEKHKKKVIMGLPGPPERPNKTTRLSLALAYVSQKKCLRCCKRSWIWRNVPFQWQGLGRTGRVVKEAGNERLYFMSDKKGGQAVFCGEY